jgi:hypothetical protein
LKFHVVGRGQRDTHPQFSKLAAPVVMMRLKKPIAIETI